MQRSISAKSGCHAASANCRAWSACCRQWAARSITSEHRNPKTIPPGRTKTPAAQVRHCLRPYGDLCSPGPSRDAGSSSRTRNPPLAVSPFASRGTQMPTAAFTASVLLEEVRRRLYASLEGWPRPGEARSPEATATGACRRTQSPSLSARLYRSTIALGASDADDQRSARTRTRAHHDGDVVFGFVGGNLDRASVGCVGAGLTRGGAIGHAEANSTSCQPR